MMTDLIETQFLPDRLARPVSIEGEATPMSLYVAEGASALEIVDVAQSQKPKRAWLANVWKKRWDRRPAPVVIAAIYGDRVALAIPMGETPEIIFDLPAEQASRLCDAALEEPGPEAARRFLVNQLPTLEGELPGLRNEGLFATHALKTFPIQELSGQKSLKVAKRNGKPMLKELGYDLADADNLSLLLQQGDKEKALAILLQRDEVPEQKNDRFNGLSPVSYAITKGEDRNLPWVILLRGKELRLYPTQNKGVSARGSTETYLELNLATLSPERIGLLWSLFSADALADGGTVQQLLEQSQRFAADLAIRLRERIYTETVPKLADAIVKARQLENPDRQALDQTYRMTLLVLFRLLFIAYAEDGDLLPYRSNEAYRQRSLTRKAQELLEASLGDVPPGGHDHHWSEVLKLFEAVDHGNEEWGVPAYNGGLFSTKPEVSREGAEIASLSIPDADFVPALRSLVLSFDEETSEQGPVDFRSLGVREFGTIYEGLLESELAVAEADLTHKAANRKRAGKAQEKDLVLVPAKAGEEVVVAQHEVYLHNKSGARKSSGSYYTKPFAVEHLLDRALEPALDDHLERVDALDDVDAAKALFDFRVADIAMGSAHFLVAAIDRIERRFAKYLIHRRDIGRPITHVLGELDAMRAAAMKALGRGAATVEIEDSQLLRRLIARRCIYGVDMNDMAVMLARLAVWIHSFVPGLPLAVLDHNLAHGNALVGMGTVESIQDRLDEAKQDLFGQDVGRWLEAAMPAMRRLQSVADATLKDVEASRAALTEAKDKLIEMRELCDVLVAEPLSDKVTFDAHHWANEENDLERQATLRDAREALDGLQPFHFPVEMPEVFLRDRPGFDVLLGNPPWKEATVEKLAFWARHFPGLRGLNSTEQKKRMDVLPTERPDLVPLYEAEVSNAARFRKTLTSGDFPGMGTGDPDVYKAFSWRFWSLAADDSGRFGVVLPRSAWAAKGSTEFRQAAFQEANAINLSMLLNKGQWVFDQIHPQYTVALSAVTKGKGNGAAVALEGPFDSRLAYENRPAEPPHRFSGLDALTWNDTATLPLLPNADSFEVFAQMRKAPRLDRDVPGEWRARPDREFDATNDKHLMDFGDAPPEASWPVFKGETFSHWDPDFGRYYAWAEPEAALKRLQKKRKRPSKRSAHAEFPAAHIRDEKTLAPLYPRVIFRDICRSTDQRTTYACLAPANVFLTNKAPYFLWPRGDEKDQAYLLGILNSISLDWYSRSFVEMGMNFFVINPFPVPRLARDNPLWQRTVALSGRLAAIDDRYADWATAVGVECGPLAPNTKQDMIHELDAVVTHLYELSRDQLCHIFETFHEGWDFQPRLDAVLQHYDACAQRLGEPAQEEIAQ